MASASYRIKAKAMMPMVASMLLLYVMLATTTLEGAEAVRQSPCPQLPLVYPFWSMCYSPAVYYGQELYQFQAVAGGYLAPEWDETNSTYYLRLSEEGAKYLFTHFTREYRYFVSQEDALVIMNADTGRFLAWQEEGEDEYFLVEVDFPLAATVGGYSFQLSQRQDVSLPCPRILGAECHAYDILAYGNSTGLAAYSEEGATYFKLSTEDLVPFLLLRSSTSIQSQRQAAAIKLVVT